VGQGGGGGGGRDLKSKKGMKKLLASNKQKITLVHVL